MGAVYLAERRKEGFTQRVALKLIRAGYIDPRLDARLVEERRILARLEHPGIARFIDGGTTDSGQSYFAMEFVQGTSLLRYCAERHTGLTARLALFLDVCEAVHFAHQRFVVHGDLKPENIWVTEDGRTKLLDFGIAELVEPSDSKDSSPRTVPWLTPAYASPEQVCGQRLTPLDDVYALGVILYELLAGVRPYETEGLAPIDLQRVVCEVEPPPPSRVARAPRDRRLLAGDLDIIVAKAMAKDPARRYASVERLADDLRRYRDRQPILARKDSAVYRLRKFTERHRVAVAAG
jgi:serine/threonine protein kinase